MTQQGSSDYELQSSRASLATINDILSKHSEDESLRRYKENLLGSAAHGDVGDCTDPRRLIVTEFSVLIDPNEHQRDEVFNLDTEDGLEILRTRGIRIKEGLNITNRIALKIATPFSNRTLPMLVYTGTKFKFRISFRVQYEIIAGITFENVMTKTLFSEKDTLMIGSYPPSTKSHTFEFPKFDYSEAPKGMFYRGKYRAKNTFFDSDGVKYLELEYPVDIVKAW